MNAPSDPTVVFSHALELLNSRIAALGDQLVAPEVDPTRFARQEHTLAALELARHWLLKEPALAQERPTLTPAVALLTTSLRAYDAMIDHLNCDVRPDAVGDALASHDANIAAYEAKHASVEAALHHLGWRSPLSQALVNLAKPHD